MLKGNIDELFNAFEEISSMPDEEFEKARLTFEQNGLVMKRDKNRNINITVKERH